MLGADGATLRATFQTKMSTPGSEAYAFGGAVTMVLRREGGIWKVASGHTSTAKPRGDW